MTAEKCARVMCVFTGICLLALTVQNDPAQTAETGGNSVRAEAPRVALTFDDGPDALCTARLLDGLKERQIPATFFIQGKCIEGQEDLILRMHQEGHLIGNHTFDHVKLTSVSDQDAVRQVIKTSNAIYEITGEYPTYIRPPFGEWRDDVDCHGEMIPVLWSLDSRDWVLQDTDQVVSRVLESVEDGDIILLHDIFETSVDAALEIADTLLEEGYEFVTVEDMIIE